MRRREFIAFLGAMGSPLAAHGQQPTIPVIGFLNAASPGPYAHLVDAFWQGLRTTGYTEGQNVTVEYRWAEGQNERLPALAADLVRHQVTLIAVPGSTPGALAAKAATSPVPIVFALGSNPVSVGLVASLGRPGGNVTGVTVLGVELAPKQLELLHELRPGAKDMAVLVNPTARFLRPSGTALVPTG